jgi:aminoglycoside N3'-acetyltransferase
MITKESLVADLRRLGVEEGDILHIKMSYKSIGQVEGGVKATIDALLEAVGPEGTIIADSYVKSYLPIKMWLCPKMCLTDDKTKSYAGAFANVIINYPGAKRSPHPIQKYVAVGKYADYVLEHNADSAPYSVLGKYAAMGAKNIRIGSSGKMTGMGTAHIAMEQLGWKQKVYRTGVTYLEGGKFKCFYHDWTNTCSEAFNNMIPLYRKFGGIINEGKVGNADAILSYMQKTIDIDVEIGTQFPYFMKCQDPACRVCRLQWKDSNGSVIKVMFHILKKKRYKAFLKTLLWCFTKRETK